ncbi:MAG TPA: four helix bundle protein [Cyclobacteriaceae bacterium]|jgi:four helix bundle protein|nr:four helix bundle protein [Cyclobacteriaceae bacterium]
MNKQELIRRTREFARRVFKLIERLPRGQASQVITYQLMKSSSSVAANYRAVIRAKSSNDFKNKMKIVLEEADESNFWLTFIADVELLSIEDKELNLLTKESNELTAIFAASIKTLNKSNLKIPKS